MQKWTRHDLALIFPIPFWTWIGRTPGSMRERFRDLRRFSIYHSRPYDTRDLQDKDFQNQMRIEGEDAGGTLITRTGQGFDIEFLHLLARTVNRLEIKPDGTIRITKKKANPFSTNTYTSRSSFFRELSTFSIFHRELHISNNKIKKHQQELKNTICEKSFVNIYLIRFNYIFLCITPLALPIPRGIFIACVWRVLLERSKEKFRLQWRIYLLRRCSQLSVRANVDI